VPTPTELLRLRGSRRAETRRFEPKPSAGYPDQPGWLSEPAAKIWAEKIPLIEPMLVATKSDQEALARMCDMIVRWRDCAEFLNKNGYVYTIKDQKGKAKCVMPFPQVTMYQKLSDHILKLEDRFGLSPSARTRLSTETQSSKATDEFADWSKGLKLAQ
jgi:P27 family predicted phage terminase small subunit